MPADRTKREFCEPDFLTRPCGRCSGTGCENVLNGLEWCADCGGAGDDVEDIGPAARNIAFALACVAIHASWNPDDTVVPAHHSLHCVGPQELLLECGLWQERIPTTPGAE